MSVRLWCFLLLTSHGINVFIDRPSNACQTGYYTGITILKTVPTPTSDCLTKIFP